MPSLDCQAKGEFLAIGVVNTSEYNLQFINKVEPFPERTMRTIHENYAEVCND